MSRQGLLVAGVVVVLGAVAGLWLMLRDGGDSAVDTADVPAPGSAAPTADPSVTPERGPSLPVVTRVDRNTNAPAELPPDEYVIDGKRIRDHRNPEDRQVVDLPPNIHPPNSQRIKPSLTAAFSDQVLAIMRECGRAVPRTSLGTKPRLEGQIVIAVKDQQAKVTSTTMQLRDVTGEAVDSTKQCIEQGALGLTAAAPGEVDLESYSINLTFGFR